MRKHRQRFILLGWLLVAGLILYVLVPRYTHFDGPLKLAYRLLRFDVGFPERIDWWEMFERDGRFYLAYAPFAAAVLVPFVALGLGKLGQPMLNAILLLAAVYFLWRLLRHDFWTRRWAAPATAAYLFGTPHLISLVQGNIWHLLHSQANLFLILALLFRRRRRFDGFGFCIACALGCRLGLLPVIPGLLLLLLPGRRFTPVRVQLLKIRALQTLRGALAPALLAFFLNAAATGSWTTTTYTATFVEWKALPVHSWSNLPLNAKVYLWSWPTPLPHFPFLSLNPDGNAFWMVSPFLLLALFAGYRSRWTILLALCAAMGFFPYLLYKWHGETQIGTRYTTDLFPFLLPLVARGMGRFRHALWKALVWLLILAALLIHLAALWQVKEGKIFVL